MEPSRTRTLRKAAMMDVDLQLAQSESLALAQALVEARSLLRQDEGEIPSGVKATLAALVRRGMWFKLSRNVKTLSCRDAAARRWRLGYEGIPLTDELRSYVARAVGPEHDVHIVFHCRGNAQFDFDAVTRLDPLKGLLIEKANVVELSEGTLGYGLINPFSAPDVLGRVGVSVIQVFDPDVSERFGETGTMMTNAGDYTWAVEFDPQTLFSDPPMGIIARVANINEVAARRATIGILTGNAPESGALLWKKVNVKVREKLGESFRGDISYPRVLVHSLPAMGWSMEIRDRDSFLERAVSCEIETMIDGGASIIAFACNTTQYYIDKFVRENRYSDISIVSMSQEIDQWTRQNMGVKIFIAGIGYVTEQSPWSAFNAIIKLPNVVLPDAKQSAMIERLAYDVKQGIPLSHCYQKFRAIIRSSGCNTVLLLLTELSIIFDAFPRSQMMGVRIVDSMDLYANTVSKQV